ncbi:glycosyltransferase family 4 protein [Clostridium botulinum]|nr:glycosyltransferase family 4 protein [Clostridium botulinum]NFP01073.1 glycosyltransferase family 4 protein [Clostridium botulinum]
MKINIIIPFTFLTGGIRVIFLYCNNLVENGHDVLCYVPMKAYRFNNSLIKNIKSSIGNTFKRRENVNWIDCKFKIKLVPIISNKYLRNADFSIATAWPTAYDLYKLKESKGKKIYFIQDYEIWSGKIKDVNSSYKLPLNRIVITKNLKQLLKDNFNVESTVIYNGLNNNEYISTEKKLNRIKTILMLYNESKNKGTDEGMKILLELYQKYKIRIILFGYRKNKKIPLEFEFYENPDRDALMNLYREADIYLFPSKHEAWGLPVMEAMANKCAIIGNDVGCIREICKNNENAIVIPDLNYQIMKEKLELLIHNDDLIRKIEENGYELAKKFEWSNSFRELEQYLLKLK